jgi:uncharacterized membrane protein YfcA
VEHDIVYFVIAGFIAQTIDGALGMAYGVSLTSLLLSMGIPPALASASVHTAEVFTTAVSGASHLKLGNVDRSLLKKLLIPGILGGAGGAYLLTQLPGSSVKPFVAVYLLVIGVRIVYKSVRRSEPQKNHRRIIPLAAAGGFMDAVGGGGWGPIVTSTLVARGNHPRYTIGTVNLSEFFVTLVQAFTFAAFLGSLHEHLMLIVGLIVGGILAAPLAAHMCRRIPARALTAVVGVLIVSLSVRTILMAL